MRGDHVDKLLASYEAPLSITPLFSELLPFRVALATGFDKLGIHLPWHELRAGEGEPQRVDKAEAVLRGGRGRERETNGRGHHVHVHVHVLLLRFIRVTSRTHPNFCFSKTNKPSCHSAGAWACSTDFSVFSVKDVISSKQRIQKRGVFIWRNEVILYSSFSRSKNQNLKKKKKKKKNKFEASNKKKDLVFGGITSKGFCAHVSRQGRVATKVAAFYVSRRVDPAQTWPRSVPVQGLAVAVFFSSPFKKVCKAF